MMFGCGVTVLQNMESSSNIFAGLHHRIARSTNCHTISMAEKVNYSKISREFVSSVIVILVVTNLKLIRNRKVYQINQRVHYIASSASMQACMNTSMDVELLQQYRVSAPTARKQRLLASKWLERKVINIGTAFGLKCQLCWPCYVRPLS